MRKLIVAPNFTVSLDRQTIDGVRQIVVVISDTKSTRDVQLAIVAARRRLEKSKSMIGHIEVQATPESADAMLKAARKRLRKAQRHGMG